MTINVETPTDAVVYVDRDGRLTVEGIKLFQKMIDALASLDDRVTTLEP